MIENILITLEAMGLLGIILAILVVVNITTKTISNTWSGEESFDSAKMGKGLLKAAIFYLSATATSVAFTILPDVVGIVSEISGFELIAAETLETLSSTGIFTIIIAIIVKEGKSALEGITSFTNIKTSIKEEITWEVIEEEE